MSGFEQAWPEKSKYWLLQSKVLVVAGASLDIQQSEFVAIVGRSGSGKSTLINILGCLDGANSGEYYFGGRNIESFDVDGLAW